MSRYIINGGHRIYGKTRIQGSKNSVLPILAATVLINGTSVITNCPEISDVDATIKILKHLGCKVTREKNTVIVVFDAYKYISPFIILSELLINVELSMLTMAL